MRSEREPGGDGGEDGGSVAAAGKHETAALKYVLMFDLMIYTATFLYSPVFFFNCGCVFRWAYLLDSLGQSVFLNLAIVNYSQLVC